MDFEDWKKECKRLLYEFDTETTDENISYGGGLFFVKYISKYLIEYNHIVFKELNPNLDIIFINENNSISSIKKGFRLSKKIISSDVPVLAILEIPSSCNKKIMLKNGDKIQWKRINDLTNLSPSLFPCVR